MPRIVTISQQKGGCGKTTVTIQIGTFLAYQGLKVALLDLDPQASLSMWYSLRECEQPPQLNLSVIAINGDNLPNFIKNNAAQFDVILLDTPPRIDNQLFHAIQLADYAILPCQLSPADIWSSQAIIDLIFKISKPFSLLLNRVPVNSRMANELRQSLSSNGIPLLQSFLGNRVAYVSSLLQGKAVCEMPEEKIAWQEVNNLGKEFITKMELVTI